MRSYERMTDNTYKIYRVYQVDGIMELYSIIYDSMIKNKDVHLNDKRENTLRDQQQQQLFSTRERPQPIAPGGTQYNPIYTNPIFKMLQFLYS